MNFINLQSLRQKFALVKLSGINFSVTIVTLALALASCANSADQKARIEACSLADSVQRNAEFDDAFDSCRETASAGDAVSQKNLGYIYYFGNSHVNKDLNESVKWFKLAAAQGNKQAQYRLNLINGGTEFTQTEHLEQSPTQN